MDKYRKLIKKRIVGLALLELVFVVLGTYQLMVLSEVSDGSYNEGLIAGYQVGLCISLSIAILITIVKLSIKLRDDRKLKMLYNKENDERLKKIRTKAGMPMLLVNSLILIVAAIVAGNYNIIIFKTLITVTIVQLTLSAVVKIYYLKKM